MVSAPTLRGGRGRSVRRLERGYLGHPVYGMRSRANPRLWAACAVCDPGWRERKDTR